MGGSVPRILGHEFSGTIEELGAATAPWQVGDAVTGSFYLFCGACDLCRVGRETLCRQFGGFIGTAVDGALAEFVVVRAVNLVRIPDGVEMIEAGVVADAVATTYHAARQRARLSPGQRAAVVGAGGGLGVHMIEMARAFGCETFAVERDPAELRRLHEAGRADVIIDSGRENWPEELAERSGHRLDACFDFVCAAETMGGALRCSPLEARLCSAAFDRISCRSRHRR